MLVFTESSSILFPSSLDTSLLQANKCGGSARTDYRSNHMLVDRAKKRRRLLKNTLDGGADSNSSSIDLNNFQGMSYIRVRPNAPSSHIELVMSRLIAQH